MTLTSHHVPVVHSGGASQEVAIAVVSLLTSTLGHKADIAAVHHHDALLQSWADTKFTVVSLNRLNVEDVLMNAVTGAAYCAAPGDALAPICPVLFEMSTEDPLFSRFQGLTVQSELGILWLREELEQFVGSIATALGVEAVREVDVNLTADFLTAVAPASRLLAADFPPLVPSAPLAEAPPEKVEAIRAELADRLDSRSSSGSGTIFVSWSKNSSRLVGAVAHRHIREVAGPEQGVYYSPTDIGRGDLWLEHFAEGLRTTTRAVFCLSDENTNSRWMAFEFGALLTSPRRPTLLGLRVHDRHPEGWMALVPKVYGTRGLWESTGKDDGSIRQVTIDPLAEFEALLTALGLTDLSQWDRDRFGREMSDAHGGDVLKALSVEAMKAKPYEIDLTDLSRNVAHFHLPSITFDQARTFSYVDLPGPVLDAFVERIATTGEADVHEILEGFEEGHPRHYDNGYSLALELFAHLSQRDDLDPESYRTIAEYSVRHRHPDSDIVEQIVGFLRQATHLPSDLRSDLDALWDSGHLTWADVQALQRPWHEVIAAIPAPLEGMRTVDELIDDLLDGTTEWFEQLLTKDTRSDGRKTLEGLLKELLTRTQSDTRAAEAASRLVDEYGTRVPASIPMLRLSAWASASNPDVLEDVYSRSSNGWRSFFALTTPWEEDLRAVCLPDPSRWVLRNLVRNEHVGHLFFDDLSDHDDPWVADAVPARRYEIDVEPHVPAGFDAHVERSVDELALHGAALISATDQTVESAAAWVKAHTTPDSWSRFVLASPIGTHLTERLGLSVPVARSLCAAPELLSRITPVHLLSYLQNAEHLADGGTELGVPFPLVSADSESRIGAEQYRRAAFVRLLEHGWAIVPA